VVRGDTGEAGKALGARGMKKLVVVRGAGDLASGTIARLAMAGFAVMALETDRPLAVRRGASFSEAVYEGRAVIEGLEARKAEGAGDCPGLLGQGLIPVLVDPEAHCLESLSPFCLVDAVMAKRNIGTSASMAPIVIALGPGYRAGRGVGADAHAVIETMRGHDLGRVIWEGKALADTGCPGEIGGKSSERVLRAPHSGRFEALKAIGDRIEEGGLVARVMAGGSALEIRSSFEGILRGLLRSGMEVEASMKVGDIDPRCERGHCFSISDKSRAIAGGVLEALLHLEAELGA